MNAPVFLVDDDAAVRDALSWLLRSHGLGCVSYACAQDFLNQPPEDAGCLILDVRMPGMSGYELYAQIRRLGLQMPAIFLTGHGDVPQAVAAIQNGAFDYIEKPFDEHLLLERIRTALAVDADRIRRFESIHSVQTRLGRLTDREREVMALVLTGHRNKIIADRLGITMRTVEVHRAHLFEKMDVRSAVELSQLLTQVSTAPGGT
jgi:two-component system response regulator DctR